MPVYNTMDNRVAIISIIVENENAAGRLNELLHQYGPDIVGRMGLPYRKRNVNLICVAIDAPINRINALTGAIGRIEGLTAKAVYSKIE